MEIIIEDEQGDGSVLQLFAMEDLARLVLGHEEVPASTEVSITFVTEERIHELNREFRSQDRPTDVLSFECDGVADGFADATAEGMPFELGDIVIAPALAKRQAAEYGLDAAEELSLLITHGLLHLCGYDHLDDIEAEAMEAREVELLTEFWGRPFKRHRMAG